MTVGMNIPVPPVQDVIETDLLCIGCQYNLRTRRAADRCPECGLAVAESEKHHKEHAGAIVAPRAVLWAFWVLGTACVLALFYAAGVYFLFEKQMLGGA